MPSAILGNVVINAGPGEVRRVRTTTRLMRLPFGKLLLTLVASALDRSGELSMEFSAWADFGDSATTTFDLG